MNHTIKREAIQNFIKFIGEVTILTSSSFTQITFHIKGIFYSSSTYNILSEFNKCTCNSLLFTF